MEKIYTIYCHRNKLNNKRYIGQTSQEVERRWRKEGEGYKDSIKFWNAIQKYGWDNFEHIILEKNLTQEEANEREVYWITYFDTFNNDDKGYNMTPGGNNYMKQLWQDEEYKEKMKQIFKISRKKSWSDKEFTEQRMQSLIQGLKDSWNDPEWRVKRIENITGDKNPNAKGVINLETGKIFTTIKEASQWAGLKSVSGIGECCKGRQKSAGKHPDTGEPLHWKYINNNFSSLNNRENIKRGGEKL